MGFLPARGPVVLHPSLEQSEHVDALVDLTEFGELRDEFLVVAHEELLRGTVIGGAVRALLQKRQLVVAHPPAAGEVLPVFDGAVSRVQLQAQGVQKVFVVHQVADFGWRGGTGTLLAGRTAFTEVWRAGKAKTSRMVRSRAHPKKRQKCRYVPDETEADGKKSLPSFSTGWG